MPILGGTNGMIEVGPGTIDCERTTVGTVHAATVSGSSNIITPTTRRHGSTGFAWHKRVAYWNQTKSAPILTAATLHPKNKIMVLISHYVMWRASTDSEFATKTYTGRKERKSHTNFYPHTRSGCYTRCTGPQYSWNRKYDKRNCFRVWLYRVLNLFLSRYL